MAKLFLLIALAFTSSGALAAPETNSQVLEKVWVLGQTQACSPEMRQSFNDENMAKIKSQIKDENDREELAKALNPFLFSFGYSHTEFFTDKMESFYLFKSLYSIEHPHSPPPLLLNPGVQVGQDDFGFFAREVLDGFPARKSGLIKGDRILSIDGEPFAGRWGKRQAKNISVRVRHEGEIRELEMPLPALNWVQTFQEATLNSYRIIEHNDKRVGYIHLWSGIHPESAQALWKAVKQFNQEKVDAVILDLRGGYGGAWWEHLDPFFADRQDFFSMTAINGEDKSSTLSPEPQNNPEAYLGPMAVLINEEVRSGKEAVAFQFKKSHRAVLIGTTTAGYFNGGGMFMADQPADYMLYLCVMRDSKLDGQLLEGIGVAPDIAVPFDVKNMVQDSQFLRALEELTKIFF